MIYHSTPNKSKTPRKPEDITLGIVHYTGSTNLNGTLDWFSRPEAKVSAHYVIGFDGTVHAFEQPTTRLWHAGRSQWQGKDGCNGFSIGYELVGPSDVVSGGFTPLQYTALKSLLFANCRDFPITAVVGHEHVSPGRKVDPGVEFNWEELVTGEGTDEYRGQLQWLGGKPYQYVEPVVAAPMEPGDDRSTLPWWKRWLA